MNMTISEEISIIANRLANEGKKPTVALVKKMLGKPVPLALLLNTLKSWQHQPEYIELPSTSQDQLPQQAQSSNSQEAIEALIAKSINPLRQEIELLKEQIGILKDQINQK